MHSQGAQVVNSASANGNEIEAEDSISVGRVQSDGTEETSLVGMVVFIASWLMSFAALFFSLLLFRLRASEWPPDGMIALDLTLPSINTCILLLSSVTTSVFVSAHRTQNLERFRTFLRLTVLLGTAFLVIQCVHWNAMAAAGLEMKKGIYPAFFYVLTVFHAFHVFVGLCLLLWLRVQSRALVEHSTPKARVRLVAMFWHFVDILWVFTFVLVYLI
jgi:cytochrome c oxidase subunit 3